MMMEGSNLFMPRYIHINYRNRELGSTYFTKLRAITQDVLLLILLSAPISPIFLHIGVDYYYQTQYNTYNKRDAF